MTEHETSRTLVKSPPELWAECSDAGSLARHLGRFGEIRITRLEPETSVAWEGEHASGTVRLEPSGWGTKVILTATAVQAVVAAVEPAPAIVAEAEPPIADEPEPVVEDEPIAPEEPWASETDERPARPGFMARLFGRFGSRRESARKEPVEEAHVAEEQVIEEPVAEAPVLEEPVAEAPVIEEPVAEAPLVEEPVAQLPVDAPAPEVPPVPEADPERAEPESVDAEAALTAALDSLGQAHHRPFSRA